MKSNEKINKKKILIILIMFFSIFAIILATNFIAKKEERIITPEIARSLKYGTIKTGDENTESEYIKFDAFFLKDLDGDGNADPIRGTCNEIGKEDTLYMELKVLSDGYFKDGIITINGANFYLNTSLIKDGIIAENYISKNTNTIRLENIQNGTQKLITGVVRSGDYSSKQTIVAAIRNNINNYSKINSVTITGTHVSSENVETKINKTINFEVDWYSTAHTAIDTTKLNTQKNNIEINEDKEEVELTFDIKTIENVEKLILKSSNISGKIPDLNGYSAKEVTITGGNVTYEYNEETKEFKARREATTNVNGFITKNANTHQTTYETYNIYKISVIYPIEAYTTHKEEVIELYIPIQAYYEAYNNPNEEFENPYISNIAKATFVAKWRKSGVGDAVFNVKVGEAAGRYYGDDTYVVSKGKPYKIYEGMTEDGEDRYIVRWNIYTGKINATQGLIIKENKNEDDRHSDTFIKTDTTELSMEDITTNVGIYFNNLQSILGDDGWFKIYNDETNELIITFTKDNWNDYNSNRPYYYKESIKHIRIETSKVNNNEYIYINNIKEIDDKYIINNYTREEFEDLQYIRSRLTVYIGDMLWGQEKHTANYQAPYSEAVIKIDENNISTQSEYERRKITISTENRYNTQKWINGSFLLKMPEHVNGININSIKTNNGQVAIIGYGVYEKDGNYFVKILTENQQEETYNIEIDCNIIPDSRVATINESIELYATNEQAFRYYTPQKDIYDVNENENVAENVNYNSLTLSLVAPNSLITNQVASNYNDNGKIIVAPNVADVDKSQRKATIEVNITNNYSSEISDIVIQGVIPFEGNKSVLGGKDLGSEYTVTMNNQGIIIPKELEGHVKVYYSTNPEPTNNLENETNGWKLAEAVENWNEIKTYIILFEDYELQKGESHTFKYEINIPEGIDYNKVSYCQHGIYFSLNTAEGKYNTETEVSKLGFMIAKQYNLEIEKYQEDTSKKISGVTFKVTEDGNETSSIRITNQEGKIAILGLYAEKIYTIQEIKTTGDYELAETKIKVYGYTTEEGELRVKYKNEDGTDTDTKPSIVKDINIVKEEGQDYKVQIEIENKVKSRLKIIKTSNEEAIRNVKFKLNGRDKKDTILTTDVDGQINTLGIWLDEIYTLEETSVKGYYLLKDEISFRITKLSTGFNLEILAGQDIIKNSKITVTDEIPTIEIEIENEKIPTYNLELMKYAKDEETTLEGAQYKIFGPGLLEEGETFTTNENGILRIEGLYEYVEENGNAKGEITGEYIIKEIYAPEGYALNNNEIKFKGKRNVEGILEIEILEGEGNIRTIETTDSQTENTISAIDLQVKDAQTSSPILAFSVEDSPIFEVTKIDEITQKALPNAKFIVYSLDENRNETYAKDINGENIGILITDEESELNGKYIVTTNELGKISLNLGEGLYRIVEVEAPEGYELAEKEEDRSYYFGIGASKAEETTFKQKWVNFIQGEMIDEIHSTYATADGGLIAAGSIYGQVDLNNDGEIDLESEGKKDGLVVKYNKDGEIEWFKNIGGNENESFTKVIQTSDNGYAIVGYASSSTINIDDTIKTNGIEDGYIIKLDANGSYQWSKTIGGNFDDYIYSVIEDESQNLIVTGYAYSDEIKVTESITITNTSDTSMGFIISLKSNGTYNWCQSIISTDSARAEDIVETTNGYVAIANCGGTTSIDSTHNISVTSKGKQNGILIGYDKSGNYVWHKTVGGTENHELSGIIKTSDNNLAVYGSNSSSLELDTDVSIGTNGGYDSFIIKYTEQGEYISNYSFGGTDDDVIEQIVETQDRGLLIGGWTLSSQINVASNNIQTGAFIIKLDKDFNVEYIDNIKGSRYDMIKTVAQLNDGGYIVGGKCDSQTVTVNGGQDTISFSTHPYFDGFVIKYDNVVLEPEIPAEQRLIVKNNLIKYKITTENKTIDEQGNCIGGNITGSYGIFDNIIYSEVKRIKYVEEVGYGENSINEIVITPEENYAILSIKINNENYKFEPDEDGNVRIPVLEEIKEDKHITVEFSNTISSIKVNHYLWTEETGTSTITVEGADSEYYAGQIGEKYVTVPNTDIEYVIITNEDYYGIDNIPEGLEPDGYYIPENATGNYTQEQQVITYYYKEKTYQLTVHHYLEGTTEQVPDINGGTVQDAITEGYKKNDEYITTKAENIDYLKYELVEIPEDAEGTITEDISITYYYKLKEFKINTYVENGQGHILGENDKPYEIVKYGENSVKDIVATPDEGYFVEKIMVNGENIEFTENEDKTVTIDKFINMTEDKEIRISFARLSGTVVTHHYILGTEDKVILIDGTEAQDVIQTGYVGEIFATRPIENIATYYEYVTSSEKTSGRYTEETQEVIYYYQLKEYNYKVEYYYDNEKDEESTETSKATYNSTITEYIDKIKDGYTLEKTEKLPLIIVQDETENVIKIYYVKRSDLKYTVNYLEEDTNEVLHEPKVVENQILEKIIEATKEVIDIEGYEYASCDKDSIIIGADETKNVITIYYIKRSDLKYTVNYLEKETSKVLHEPKVVEDQVYGGIITASTEVINIEGYNYDSCDKESITLVMDEKQNILNIYYTIKTDIKYKVEYYYDGIKDEEETEEYQATYKEIINEYDDKTRENYVLVEVKGTPLTIEEDESKNVIEVYYIRKAKATAQYIDKITGEILDEITEEGYIGKEFETEAKNFDNYILVEEPEEKIVSMKEEVIILKYYYIHISSGVIEKHIDIDTGEILDNITYEGNEGDKYKTEPKEFEHYELVEEKYPKNAEGNMTKETITVNYYYKKIEPITITVKYIDKDTNEEIEEKVTITDYEGTKYKTEQKEIDGYEFVEVVGEAEGTITEEKEIIYYYQKVKQPEIPGEGGDDPKVDEEQKQPQSPDTTITDKVIPSAGLGKIAVILVTTISIITIILIGISIKIIILHKEYKD